MVERAEVDMISGRIGGALYPQVPEWERWFKEIGCGSRVARDLLGATFISLGAVLLQDGDKALTKEKFLDIAGGLFDGTMANLENFEKLQRN